MNKIAQEKTSLPLVVIFGRANVGKSSLFNCLAEKHQALISEVPGTTRDSNLNQVSWRGLEFTLVDTGGILDVKKNLDKPASDEDDVGIQVERQVLNYLQQADLILFLVDNKTGILPPDKELVLLLKKKVNMDQVVLAANKVDAPKDRLKISEFYRLALGEPLPISAANGSGTGDLLDVVVEKLVSRNSQLATSNLKANNNDEDGLRSSSYELRACIIGQPNVGKSSLLNSLLGYQRVIVSPEPHTTREPQHTKMTFKNQAITLIDTAGISK